MPRSSLVGQVLGGRYRIDTIVGQGGMSAVYRAYDPNLKRAVAVKTIHSHLADDPRFLVRFEEEAAAVAQLRHPNIVQVYDFSHDGDLYYMVQEFLAGETLQERLRRLGKAGKRMPLAEVIGVALEVCEAAGYAHRRGMIHRDIKPANIMLDVHGHAILMDFGIVKIAGAEQHTATGAVVGTALYMPPEVIQGEAPDARSDLYSLGVMLFEMVSGRPPFEADSAITLMMMHVQDPVPDLHALRPGVPDALIAVIEKALAKRRDDRYASMAGLAAALKQAQQALEATAAPGATALEAPELHLAEPAQPAVRPAQSPQRGPAVVLPGREAGPGPARDGRVSAPAGRPASAAAILEPMRTEGAGGALAEDQAEPVAGVPGPARRQVRPAMWIGGAVVVLALIAGVLFGVLRSSGDGAKAAEAQPADASPLATRPAATVQAIATASAAEGPTAPAAQPPAATPAPGSVVALALQDLACRSGPAEAFPAVAQLAAGQTALVRGLSPDEGWWNVGKPDKPDESCWLPVAATQVSGEISKLPLVEGPPLPAGGAAGRHSVEIGRITIDEQGRYVVEFDAAGFEPQLPGTHIHFFFDSVPPEQVGITGEGQRLMYGGPSPFTGYLTTDRPADAVRMCALVANPDHSVVQDSGNCQVLPDAP